MISTRSGLLKTRSLRIVAVLERFRACPARVTSLISVWSPDLRVGVNGSLSRLDSN